MTAFHEWCQGVRYEELPEVQAHLADHLQRRAAANIEVRHTGWLHWEWRFYFGRYVVTGSLLHWAEYERGVAFSMVRAMHVAQRHMARLHRRYQPWSTS